MKANFELVTELSTLHRRDFAPAVESLLNPYTANPLVDGEWLELNSGYKLIRGTDAEGLNPNVFPVHTERGRYDTQAVKKVNVIMLGAYEAETLIVDATGLAVGDELTVQDVIVGGLAKRGLKKAVGATAGRAVVGYVSRLSGGYVRFVHTGVVKRG